MWQTWVFVGAGAVFFGLLYLHEIVAGRRFRQGRPSWLRPLIERAERGDDTAEWDTALAAHPEALANPGDVPAPERIAEAATLLRSQGCTVHFSVDVAAEHALVRFRGIGVTKPLDAAVFRKVAPLLTTAATVLCDPDPARTLPPGTVKPYGRMRAPQTFWSYDPHTAEAAGVLV